MTKFVFHVKETLNMWYIQNYNQFEISSTSKWMDINS